MLLLLPLLTAALAADPWDRPEHLRAVSQPPARYADLDAASVPIRLWWDHIDGALYEVQAQRKGRWKTLATDATPGWTSKPLPAGTTLRVRRVGAEQGRWSEPLAAPPWASPTDLARLAGPEDAVLGGGVGQLAVAGGSVWASILGGGLAETTTSSAAVRSYTRWEGLPDDEVVAIDARDEQVLVGTASGAALIDGGQVVQVWDEVLPDPYVQAVLLGSEGTRWLGTYQGLARVSDAGVEEVLAPWSVFSLAAETSGDVWVGYEGLRRFDPVGNPVYPPPDFDEAPPPAPEPIDGEDTPIVVAPDPEAALIRDLLRLKVYDAALMGESRWLATENFGLVLYADGDINPVDGYPRKNVYGVAVNTQGVWAAGDRAGLVGPGGVTLGRSDGLPSDTVWSVAAAGSGLWVGTDAGLALVMLDPSAKVRAVLPQPHTLWPADRDAADLIVRKKGIFVAGEDGVWLAGEPHRSASDLSAAAGEGVVALLEVGDTVWSVGEALVGLDRKGRLERVALPAPAVAATVWNEQIWIADGTLLWRYEPAEGKLLRVAPLEGVVGLSANTDAIWAVTEKGKLSRVLLGASRPFTQVDLVLDAQPSDDGYVCVGTGDGLVRLLEDSGDAEDVLGDRDSGVRVPAVAVDPEGGCWFAAEDGTVGRTFLDGREAYTYLPDESVGEPQRIVPDGEDAAWILTSRGTWRVRLPGLGAQ